MPNEINELTVYEINSASKMTEYTKMIYVISGFCSLFILCYLSNHREIKSAELVSFLLCLMIMNIINVADAYLRRRYIYGLIHQKTYSSIRPVQLSRDKYNAVLNAVKNYIVAPFVNSTLLTIAVLFAISILKKYECYFYMDNDEYIYCVLAHITFLSINKLKCKTVLESALNRYKKLRENLMEE